MNIKLPQKREADKSNKILPNKMVSEVLETPGSANYDVVITIDGQRFHCLKEELSHHSMYFQRMFSSSFQEADKKEVELGGMVESEKFDMFLKAVHGEDVVTDGTVETLLKLAVNLESATLEANCVHHLDQKTRFSLKEKFQMAETYHSEKLMIQVCSSIRDAYELDEVVPKDLDSFCDTFKNIVMQRSFELLGIRRPPLPPLPENPDHVFEHLMNQIIDQVDVQNFHGEVLKDQVELLFNHLITECHFSARDETAKEIIRDDPLIKELLDQLREAHEQGERNFILAQIQVLTLKYIYTRVKNEELGLEPDLSAFIIRDIPSKLRTLSAILNRDERSQSRSHKVTLGDREIDGIYQRLAGEAMQQNQADQPRNMNDSAIWVAGINDINDILEDFVDFTQHQIQRLRPDNQREVSNGASFWVINELIRNARDFYYSVPQNRRE